MEIPESGTPLTISSKEKSLNVQGGQSTTTNTGLGRHHCSTQGGPFVRRNSLVEQVVVRVSDSSSDDGDMFGTSSSASSTLESEGSEDDAGILPPTPEPPREKFRTRRAFTGKNLEQSYIKNDNLRECGPHHNHGTVIYDVPPH